MIAAATATASTDTTIATMTPVDIPDDVDGAVVCVVADRCEQSVPV